MLCALQSLFEDSRHLLSCSHDRSFLCWDLQTEKRISAHTQKVGAVNHLALTRDQKEVITVGQDKKIS